jgi:hypothetical protein
MAVYPSASGHHGLVWGGPITPKSRIFPLGVAIPPELTEGDKLLGLLRNGYAFQYPHTRERRIEMSFNPDVPLKFATEQLETGNELCFIEIVSQRPLGRKVVRNAGFIL